VFEKLVGSSPPDMDMTPFLDAAYNGREADIETMLRDPGLDVNQCDLYDQTALYLASHNGHAGIVKKLLANPRTNVNALNKYGWTALHTAGHRQREDVVQLLLNDARTDVNNPAFCNCTVLITAASRGDYTFLRQLIKCGKFVDLDIREECSGNRRTALELSRALEYVRFSELLEMFESSPIFTRFMLKLRDVPADPIALAALCFSYVVLLCDEFYTLRPSVGRADELRFLTIASRLPIEVQMVLCNYAVGNPGTTIRTEDSESAFVFIAVQEDPSETFEGV
jgi:hypothetical protein